MRRTTGPKDDSDDHSYKVKHGKIHCKEKSNFPEKAVHTTNIEETPNPDDDDEDYYESDRYYEEMEEDEDETYSLHKNILFQSNDTASSSDNEEQWEIIRVPFSSRNLYPNEVNTQELVSDFEPYDAKATKMCQQNHSFIPSENIVTQNSDTYLNSPKTKTHYFSIFNSTITSGNICTPVNGQQEAKSCYAHATRAILDENTNIKEVSNDTNTPGMILEGTNHMGLNYISKFVLPGNQNHLPNNTKVLHKNPEPENNCNHSNRTNKEQEKRTDKTFFPYSNLKRCCHSNNKSNLLIVKNSLSKLKMGMPKYSVINSKKALKSVRIKNGINKRSQKTGLEIFILNTMKVTHPDLCLSATIQKRLELFLVDILHRLGDEAEILVTLSNKKLFDKRVLKYAIKLALEKMKNEADVVSGKRNQWIF